MGLAQSGGRDGALLDYNDGERFELGHEGSPEENQAVRQLLRRPPPRRNGGLNGPLGLINYCFHRGATGAGQDSSTAVVGHFFSLKSLRFMLLAGVAAVALGACATNHTTMSQPDFSGQSATQSATAPIEQR